MKKFLALLLAAIMAFSMSIAVAAANDPDPTKDPVVLDDPTADLKDHTFTAYQIFAGTQSIDDPALGNIVWGKDIDSSAFVAALTADDMLKAYFPAKTEGTYSAAEIAEIISEWTDGSQAAFQFAKLAAHNIKSDAVGATPGETLEAGYYVVVDTTADGKDIYNVALLQLTKKDTFDVKSKVAVPKVEKKIKSALNCNKLDEKIPDPNDSAKEIANPDYNAEHEHTAECYDWVKSDKKPVGGVEEFKIDTAVPAAAATYDFYYFIVKDTMTDGLTFNNDIVVTIGGKAAIAGTDYTLKTGDATELTFEIALIDAKAHAGEAVVVTYTGTVNEKAIIGTTGNPNEVKVDYSNKPNTDYDGTEDKNYPGFPDSTKNVPIGVTPKSTTLTYVTEIALYKVDEKKNPLQGAEFTLEGDTIKTVLVYKEVFTADNDGKYYQLKAEDGKEPTYTKEAPVTADYMKEVPSSATEGYVVGEDTEHPENNKKINSVTYRPYVPETDVDKTVYILVEANADQYTSTTQKYKMTKTLSAEDTDGNTSVTATVDDNGYVSFSGLDAGDYTLTESKTPAGYNTIDPIEFTIEWTAPASVTTGEEKCTWSVDSDADIKYNDNANAFEITIVNQKGSVLPETGGIGTTIFYVFGAVLVLASAVLLITRRRMNAGR